MKLDSTDKLMLFWCLFLVFGISLIVGAYENRVSRYKSIARFYYHRDVLHEAEKGICSDTPQIDDAKMLKELDVEGHRQIQKDINWVQSEYFKD